MTFTLPWRDIQEPAADGSGAQHYGDKHFLPVHDCSVKIQLQAIMLKTSTLYWIQSVSMCISVCMSSHSDC